MNTCVNTLPKVFSPRVFPLDRPSLTDDSHRKNFTGKLKPEKYSHYTIDVDWIFPKNLPEDDPLREVAWAYPRKYDLCMRCEKIFIFNRWPHHCRACGVMICRSCTAHAKVVNFDTQMVTRKKVRVCTWCHNKRSQYVGVQCIVRVTKTTQNPAPQMFFLKRSDSQSNRTSNTDAFADYKKRGINKNIQLLSFSRLKELRKFPHYVDVETITVESLTEEEYEKSPDDLHHSKYKLCIGGIQQILDLMAVDTQCYIWFDYCCLSEEDLVNLVQLLPEIMKLCDVMFTPVLDEVDIRSDSQSVSGEYPMFLKQKPFKDYADRGWCRAEMSLALVIPQLYLSPKRSDRFNFGLKNFKNRNRRPHIVYGTREKVKFKSIIFLPPLQSDFFEKFRPMKQQFSYVSDYEKIKELMKSIPRPDPRIARFEGDVDDNNLRQNGTFVFRNGDYYFGEFCGKMHGRGTYTFANGDRYRGLFDSGKRHGEGTMVFASGVTYCGAWENDQMHGNGVMISKNGMWIRGEWDKGKLDGKVEAEYPSIISKSFKGRYKNGLPCGIWVCRDSDDRVLIKFKYDNAGKFRSGSLIDYRNADERIPSESNDLEDFNSMEGLGGTEDIHSRNSEGIDELIVSEFDEVEELVPIEGLDTEDVVEGHEEPEGLPSLDEVEKLVPIEGLDTEDVVEGHEEPEGLPSLDEVEKLVPIEGLDTEDVVEGHEDPEYPELIPLDEGEEIIPMEGIGSVENVDSRGSEGLDELIMSQLDEVERTQITVERMQVVTDCQLLDLPKDKSDILLVWCLAFVLFLWYITIFNLLF